MRGYELDFCPFCGGEFRWVYRRSIGRRLIEGWAECEGCGCRVGEGLVALDDDDLRVTVAGIVNNRRERTVEASLHPTCDPMVEYLKCECGKVQDVAVNEERPRHCSRCGVRLVVRDA